MNQDGIPAWAETTPVSAKPKTLALGERRYRVFSKENRTINGGNNGLLSIRLVAEEGMADGDTILCDCTLDFNLDDFTVTTEKVQAAVDAAKERLRQRVENMNRVDLNAIS